MTQNLDFDLQEGITLTANDPDGKNSDVVEDWTPGVGEGTIGEDKLSSEAWPETNNIIRSYDAGLYVYTKPTVSKNCAPGSAGLSGGTCKEDGWVNVASMTPSSDPNFGTGITDNVYNAHYLIGNHYSWLAAVANSGGGIATGNVDAPSSICPKNWRLPSSKRSDTEYPIESSGSYAKLFKSYGAEWSVADGSSIGFPIIFNNLNLMLQPFYLLYGGFYLNGGLGSVGDGSYYWTATVASSTHGRLLGTGKGNSYPAGNNWRYRGFTVRCVSR